MCDNIANIIISCITNNKQNLFDVWIFNDQLLWNSESINLPNIYIHSNDWIHIKKKKKKKKKKIMNNI